MNAESLSGCLYSTRQAAVSPKAAALAANSPKAQSSEKFQSVMERLARLFLDAASQTVPSPQSTVVSLAADGGLNPLKSAEGKTSGDTADGGDLPMPQSKPDSAPMPDVLIPPANLAPIAAELAAAVAQPVPSPQSPVVGLAPDGGLAAVDGGLNPLKSESSSVVAVDVAGGRSIAGLSPATAALSRMLGEADAGQSIVSGPQSPVVSLAPGGGLATVDSGLNPLKSMNLREALSPAADRAPSTGSARPASHASHAESVPGAPLPPLEKSGDVVSIILPGEKTPEIQQQPATITITTGPHPAPARTMDSTKSDDGTTVAQQDATMKTTAKKTSFSGAKQKLPASASGSDAAAPVAGENLPVASKRGEDVPDRSQRDIAPATIKIRVEPAMPASAAISTNDDAAKVVSPEMADLPRVVPSSVPYVQRTQELVSSQVMRLHESGADTMRVVINPDAGLQLSLHLQQRGNSVEVQAVLDRGNFGLLNRHWPELQQQLELRGVRVAPLANAEQSFGGGSEGFRQPTTSHGQHAGDDAELPAMAAVLLPGLPPATATASASTISSQHLETWA